MVLKLGESDLFYCYNNEMVYFEKGSKLKIEMFGGEQIVVDVFDGYVMWYEVWIYRVINFGEQIVIVIIVEEKQERFLVLFIGFFEVLLWYVIVY